MKHVPSAIYQTGLRVNHDQSYLIIHCYFYCINEPTFCLQCHLYVAMYCVWSLLMGP